MRRPLLSVALKELVSQGAEGTGERGGQEEAKEERPSHDEREREGVCVYSM